MYILNKKVRNYTKDLTKLLSIVIVATLTILAIMLVKYRFVYKVTIAGQEVGYVVNKNQFKKLIEEEIIKKEELNVAYVDLQEEPSFELVLNDDSIPTNEEEIFEIISQDAIITYKVYAIAVDGNNAAYVNSIEEAEQTVDKIKGQYEDNEIENIDITVNEIYTSNIDEIEKVVEVASAVETAKEEVVEAVEEQERIKAATFDGVYFKVKPVTGNITSRYGDMESIRSHAHSGMDICAPAGTDIMAAADGTVTFAGVMGGYGNLIIITHENGIQTYYGHCSKLYASVGDEVEAGDVIAAVGMTGYATGNHLHFEIRKDGTTINPQRYLYN